MFASQSQGTPRAAYPRNRLDDLSDSSAHEDNDDEEEDQPQERAFSIPMSEIDPTLVEDFDNNQVQRAADSEHNEDVVQPAASISGTQQEEQQRPLRPGLYNRSQKKMPSTEAMFAELRSKPSAKSPTEGAFRWTHPRDSYTEREEVQIYCRELRTLLVVSAHQASLSAS